MGALDRLVSRTLESAPVARPVLTPLFAAPGPPPPLPGLPVPEARGAVPAGRATAEPRSSDRPAGARAERLSLEEWLDSPARQASASDRFTRAVLSAGEADANVARPRGAAWADPAESAAHVAAVRETVPTGSAPRAPIADAVTQGGDAAQAARGSAAEAIDRLARRLDAREAQDGARPAPRIAGDDAASARRPAAANPPVVFEQSVSSAAGAPAEAPVVRVSIGRVLVRAILPPPSPRPAARPGPAGPTLEEYLRGGRR